MTPTRFIDAANVTCDGTLYGSYDFDWHLLIPKLRQILAPEVAPADHLRSRIAATHSVRSAIRAEPP